MTIVPELTPLDRRVLEAVQNRPSQPFLHRGRDGTLAHGLERFGYVRRKGGGWWQANRQVEGQTP